MKRQSRPGLDGRPLNNKLCGLDMDSFEKRHLAQLVRQVAAGTVAIDDLEDAAIQYDDGSLFHELLMAEIYDLAEYPAEFWTGRFRGRRRLDGVRRKSLARLSLFLYSESKYKWPALTSNCAHLGLGGRVWRLQTSHVFRPVTENPRFGFRSVDTIHRDWHSRGSVL